MDKFENQIKSQVETDKLDFTVDEGIHERLMYHMQLKSVKSQVRKNSFLPDFSFLATSKFLSVKLGVLAIAFMFFMGYRQINQQSNFIQLSDTVCVSNCIDTIFIDMNDSLQIR